ncbi:enoyl-CoA hydratase-related protein, partial [Parvibaculum sp.]|uniref:enoyl-CoA hydratase-related protein n=1 Tax=Parvibaculum sp. TaxID=2024848 RepID=UPI0034A09906
MAEVLVEKNGPVTTVILNRPQAKNAVDRAAANALAAAFLDFEQDEAALAAVFCGAEETFCAGADLKAVGAGGGNRIVPPATGADFDRL